MNDLSVDQSVEHQHERSHTSVAVDTSSHWVLVGGGRSTWRRFMADWRALSTDARRTWLQTIVVAWIVTFLLLIAMIGLMRWLLSMNLLTQEEQWLERAIALAPFDFSKAVWLSAPGDVSGILIILGLTIYLAVHARKPLYAASIVAAYFLISAVVLTGWQLWDRPRPELIFEGAAAPDFHSFPSGHMAEATAVYGLYCYFWMRRSRSGVEKILAVLLCVLLLGAIGWSRLVIGTHWVTDVVAGALLGCCWLAGLITALERAHGRQNDV